LIAAIRQSNAQRRHEDGKHALAGFAWEALEGFKFKRQVPIDGYIVDFVCFEARLIIEVDGAQHAESTKDVVRDAYFSTQGFRTVRVWNHEVTTNLEGVCLTILAELKNSAE